MSFRDFKNTKIGVLSVIALSLVLNMTGKFLATFFSLPLWLDSFGTCLAAYLYGPICGAIVGVGLNISYGIFDRISLVFGIVSAILGIACGIMARKGFFKTVYGSFFAGFIMALLAIAISTPIKMIAFDGYSGNIWNDGFFEMLMELGFPRWLSSLLGQFAMDFIDKNIITLSLYLLLRLYRSRHFHYIVRKIRFSVLLVLLVFVKVPELNALDVKFLDEGFFMTTTFNASNGLMGGEANSVEFSKDGYLWVGTYGGLYQYDGNNFKLRKDYKTVKNVNCLYSDEEGRLWIGTNDNGFAVRVGDRISNALDMENGLSSNSVRAINRDIYGNYYIGTSAKLNVVQLNAGMRISATIDEVVHAKSIASSEMGLVAVTDNSGACHVLKNGEYLYTFKSNGLVFNSVVFPNEDNTLFVGTSLNKIFVYDLRNDGYEKIGEIDTGYAKFIKTLKKDENGVIWVCSDTGAGYINFENKFVGFDTGRFASQLDDMGIDYQGNLWLASSRLGLLRVSECFFTNVYKREKLFTDVINAVAFWNGNWYFGSDNGLDVFDENFSVAKDIKNVSLAERLNGSRIRSLFVDSKNHLWVCSAGGEGLIEVAPDSSGRPGKTNSYNKKNGALSNRYRTAIELSDGSIIAGEYAGLNFISPLSENGERKVIKSITQEDGLTNSVILSLFEKDEKTVFAGTDGGGVAVIRNREFEKMISRKDGLTSDVILKIVGEKNGDGVFILTGNGISYLDENENLRNLETFPYTNNFDLFENDDGKVFVLSGAGIYILDKRAMLSGMEFDYVLLSEKDGLTGTITANSKNYFSPDGKLFVCCNDGCYMIDTEKYEKNSYSYLMIVDYVLSDGDRHQVSKTEVIEIPGDSKNLIVHPVFLNYTMNEPYVGYMLEGFDREETIVRSKELTDITYSNLPSGNYNFVMKLYSDGKEEEFETVSYKIVKKLRIFEHIWFKIYFVLICMVFIAWCTWVIARQYNKKIIEEEKRKLELAELNAKMSDETIMTIAQTVDARDTRTSKHSVRVSEYSAQIAKKLGWTKEECEGIRKMGLLHDIGKIGIPDSILNKPGKLTDDEYALMKTHVERGAEILKNFTLVKDVDLGAKYHHERYDGEGYPQGLKGEEIPIYARIIGIADAFDAMTSNRVYRNQLDLESVIWEMERCKGTQFDPMLTDLFLGLINDGTIDVEVLYKK